MSCAIYRTDDIFELMPHISKHKLNKEILDNLDGYLLSFLVDTDAKTRKLIFREVLTRTEKIMIAKRLGMLYYISKGESTHEIGRLLKVSSSTVARFELARENKHFGITEKWVQKYLSGSKFLRLLGELAVIPFEARKKSFKQFVDEKF